EHDAGAGIERGHVDDLRVRQLAFELLDAALDEALLFARSVVFGVFLQVAVRTRFGDRVDHRRALDRLEFIEFRAQALRALGGQWCSHCFLNSWCSSCSAHTGPLPRYSRECSKALAPAMVVE